MYDFSHIDVTALLRARGDPLYSFNYEKHSSSLKTQFVSEYMGLCIIDIYNMAQDFKKSNSPKSHPWQLVSSEVISKADPMLVVTTVFLIFS